MLDLVELQEYHQSVLSKIIKLNGDNDKLFCYLDYFNELNELDDKLITDAFLFEPFYSILPSIKKFVPFGVNPSRSEEVLNMLRKTKNNDSFAEVYEVLENNITRIESDLSVLSETLSGAVINNVFDLKVNFPLIEKKVENNNIYGSVDYLSISLNHVRKLTRDEFFVIPSLPSIDKKLTAQIENSWKVAKNFFKNEHNIKIPNLEAVIKFNKKFGIYQGDSLGIALTLAFISEISHHFDFRTKYKINQKVLFTGVVNSEGKLISLRNVIMRKKATTAFYSNCTALVFPKDDFIQAQKTIEIENTNYANRELTLVPADHINDILHNENIVKKEIQSFNKHFINRLKNKRSILALSLLVFITSVFYVFYGNRGNDFLQNAIANHNLNPDELKPIENDDALFSMKLDEDKIISNSNSVIDSLINIEYTENRFGEQAKAVSFNGKNSYIKLKNIKGFKIDFPISISLWIKKSNSKRGGLFTNSYDRSKYYGVYVSVNEGNYLALGYGNGEKISPLSRRSIVRTNPFKINTWYHIVAIFSGLDDLRLYINGQKETRFVNGGMGKNLIYSSGEVYIGRTNHSSVIDPMKYIFEGDIDDFRFYNRILNQEEIGRLFHEYY